MRMTLRTKIFGGFLAMILLIALLGGVAVVSTRNIQGMLATTYETDLQELNETAEILAMLHNLRVGAHRYVGAPSAEKEAAIAKTIDGDIGDFQQLVSAFARRDAAQADAATMTSFRNEAGTFLSLIQQASRVKAESGAVKAAWLLERDGRDHFLLAEAAITKLHDDIQAGAGKRYEASKRAAATTLAVTILVLLGAIGLAVLMALLLARSIVEPIRQMKEAAQGIAGGELDRAIDIRRDDEIGEMARSFGQMIAYLHEVAGIATAMSQGDLSRTITPKSPRDQLGNAIAHMVESLREIVQRVRHVSDAVGAGAHQIASSSGELHQTVSVQASSAEETSAAIEQMAANIQSVDRHAQDLGSKVTLVRGQSDELAAAVTQTTASITELAASVQQVAGNVGHANQVASRASDEAQAGETAVAQASAGMASIADTMQGIQQTIRVLDERSGEIGAIIEVIDDIAEQTNLLALNAAIEAARAGEAGRGFAVVADEVRKLAERSAKATREIGDLIKGIQKETLQAVGVTEEGARKVEEGVQLAAHTREALTRIKGASQQVTNLLNEVAAATGEQARASAQIVAASEQMANVNQHVTEAVAGMDQLTRSVAYATAEQRQGASQVVLAVESLSRSAQEASSATDQVSRAADSLNAEGRALQEAIAFFKLSDAASTEARIPAQRPLSLPTRL